MKRLRPSEFRHGPLAIVGMGLIGGALAKAVRTADPDREIIAIDPDPSTRAAIRRLRLATKVVSGVDGTIEAARTIVVASPIAALGAILGRLAQHMRPDALLSDAIGVKLQVASLIARRLPSVAYVGAHPMAGGARGGFENSRDDLFRGSPVIISPGPNARPAHLQAVRGLWRAVGAYPIQMSAEDHDRGVALTSHLPYAVGLSLIRLAAERPAAFRLTGPSFHDVTKRVDFEPKIMAAVVASNPFIPDVLRQMAAKILRLADLIERNPADLLAEARRIRRTHLARGR
ncbi:MAG TPA: prephenate dehydrogenase/arogenate dehydrogenase family protein [Polyangia bacterium]|nr:prephenate dehydrogenase/arogenate dehydrogenase family protein [Polyangia bacterium]